MLSWYLGKLKSHPALTNLSSAVVIMTAGDVMAQALEVNKLGDKFAGSNPEFDGIIPERRRLHSLQYGGHSHEVHKKKFVSSPAISQEELHSLMKFNGEESSFDWSDAAYTIFAEFRREFEVWDGFRTATMAVWGAGIYAPAFMYLYRLYDRFLPVKSPPVVIFQVLFNVMFSVPVNALFFAYGSFVHHTSEWFAIQNEVPFDWEMMFSKAHLKIHSDLYTTMSNSAKAWVPINAITFTVVPPHLRPLSFMVCSVFWNCYLSLVQHRDVALKEGA